MAVSAIYAVGGKNRNVVCVVKDFPELDRPFTTRLTGSTNNREVSAR